MMFHLSAGGIHTFHVLCKDFGEQVGYSGIFVLVFSVYFQVIWMILYQSVSMGIFFCVVILSRNQWFPLGGKKINISLFSVVGEKLHGGWVGGMGGEERGIPSSPLSFRGFSLVITRPYVFSVFCSCFCLFFLGGVGSVVMVFRFIVFYPALAKLKCVV